jgi:hypothetical protein
MHPFNVCSIINLMISSKEGYNLCSLVFTVCRSTAKMALSINSTKGTFNISKNTLGGKGSPWAANLANMSTCSLSSHRIFFTENPSKEDSILRTISKYFSKPGFFALLDLCWNYLSVARRPTGVNSVDSRVTREMANSSVNQASHGHYAGVFIGS